APSPYNERDGVPSDSARLAALYEAAAALLRSAHGMALFMHATEYAPEAVAYNPRLGFHPPDGAGLHALPPEGVSEGGKLLTYECKLTRKPFRLQKSAPIPCLIYDLQSVTGEWVHRRWLPVHPAVFVRGPEAVYA